MNLDNTLLVTHKNCLDGSSSALVYMQAGGKRENILFLTAGQVSNGVKRHKLLEDSRTLLFCDLSVDPTNKDKSLVEALEKRGNCFYIDHHRTSLPLQGKSWCLIDMQKSGCCLLRDHLGLSTIPWIDEFCLLVDDYDRGIRYKFPYSRDLVTFHSFVGSNEFLDKFTQFGLKHRFEEYKPSWLTHSENEMLRILNKKQEQATQSYLDSVIFKYIEISTNTWARIGYVLAPDVPNYSDLLSMMLKRYTELQIACVVHVGRGTVSLVSRGNIDVSELASRFGGGGHLMAAGHELNRNVLNEFITGIHDTKEEFEIV